MNYSLFSLRKWSILSIFIIFNLIITPTLLTAQQNIATQNDSDDKKSTAKKKGGDASDVLETVLKYDAKTRLGKIILESVKESKKADGKVNFKKTKKLVLEKTGKPFFVHFGMDMGFSVVGTAFQYALIATGPLGVAAGTLVNSTLSGLGGAVGYEVSESMRSNDKKSKREIVGQSIKNIDGASFAGRTIGGIIGSVCGSFFPIPWIGVALGGMLGSFIGGVTIGALKKTSFGKKICDKIQQGWNWIGDKIAGKKSSTTENDNTQEVILSPVETETTVELIVPESQNQVAGFDTTTPQIDYSLKMIQGAYERYIQEYRNYQTLARQNSQKKAAEAYERMKVAKQTYFLMKNNSKK